MGASKNMRSLQNLMDTSSIPESVEKDNYLFVNFDDLSVQIVHRAGLALRIARKWCRMGNGKKFYRNTL